MNGKKSWWNKKKNHNNQKQTLKINEMTLRIRLISFLRDERKEKNKLGTFLAFQEIKNEKLKVQR